MPEALLINGVYNSVLQEIVQMQKALPEHIMFLQPYSQRPIAELRDHPPSVSNPIKLFISVSDDLQHVKYEGEIVGWDSKPALEADKRNVIQRLIWAFQPGEQGLYMEINDKPCQNLLHVWRMREVDRPYPVDRLIKTSDGEPYSMNRSQPGGWSYVQEPTSARGYA